MQQLSMDDLAVKSTAVVRGRVTDTYMALTGSTVYTHYHLAVSETWKGTAAGTVDVALPGGTASGIQQSYPGVPQLAIGTEYVVYLWTSPGGLTMPTGFSQGIFTVTGTATSAMVLTRSASSELMLDASGHPVHDHPISMPISDMKSAVASALSKFTPIRPITAR